jgi:hypothetical protein
MDKSLPLPMPDIQVPALTSANASGKRYERSATVRAEICQILQLPNSAWPGKANELQNETLVFLVRKTYRVLDELCGSLLEELRKRIPRLSRRLLTGLDPLSAEDILLNAEIAILELVLSSERSLKTEFLEVAFAQALETLTIDVIRKQKKSAMDGRGEIVEVRMDEEIERSIELIPDDQPTAFDTVLQSERLRLLDIAYAAVEDPRHLDAVKMHYLDGMPIHSIIRGRKCLTRHFRKSPREIQYWIDTALKQMRAALGVELAPRSNRPRAARKAFPRERTVIRLPVQRAASAALDNPRRT